MKTLSISEDLLTWIDRELKRKAHAHETAIRAFPNSSIAHQEDLEQVKRWQAELTGTIGEQYEDLRVAAKAWREADAIEHGPPAITELMDLFDAVDALPDEIP